MPESPLGPAPKLQAKQDAWNQWAEFIGVWSLIAAFLVCPWVGGAALAETGEFAPVAAGRLWRLSLCLLFVSTLTFALSFEHKIGRGESARQALGGIAAHLLTTVSVFIASFIAADLFLALVKPLPAAAYHDVPKAQIYGWGFARYQTILVSCPDLGKICRERANSEGWRDVEHSREKTVPPDARVL